MKAHTNVLMLHRRNKLVFNKQDLILNFDKIRSDVTDFARSNPLTASLIAIGTPVSFAGIAAIGKKVTTRKKAKTKKRTTRKKKKNGRRKTTTRRRSCPCPKRRTRRKSGIARAKKGASRRIRTTKKGQPYIILANGRARFIKKSSAKLARKRKGGFH